MRNLLLTTCSLLLASCASAQLADPWSVNIRDNAAVQRTYRHGESWVMQVSLRDGLAPLNMAGMAAQFLWNTNGMGNLWWKKPAQVTGSTVSALWEQGMDTGADTVNYIFDIRNAAGAPLWRASGTIRLLPSPGFIPNTSVYTSGMTINSTGATVGYNEKGLAWLDNTTLYLTPAGLATALPNTQALCFQNAGAVTEITGVDIAAALLAAFGADGYTAEIGTAAWSAQLLANGTPSVIPVIQFRRSREGRE